MIAAASAGVLCLVLAGYYLTMSSFAVQDSQYDNVPSKVSCDEVPSHAKVQAAIDEFPAIDDADPLSVDRCDGAILEIQYGSTATREKIEEFLDKNGKFAKSTGWWWRSVPVSLRNV